jgi:hypothetical protein
MKQSGVVLFLLFATSAFAGDSGLNCEAESYSAKNDCLVVVCPPRFAFSPIRIQMVIRKIDPLGWDGVDLKKPTAVQVVLGSSSSPVLVRLPVQQGEQRRLTWRRFGKVTDLSFWDEDKIVTDRRNPN